VKTIHTILREDFGQLDRHLVRAELLREAGIHEVGYETARNGLCIEYDPVVLTPPKLAEVLCRHGVFPNPVCAPEDAPERSDGH